MTIKTITITKPDDWHLHLRDGEMLGTAASHTARSFSRAIVMPNLKPPVTTVGGALAYRQRILDALPTDTNFSPLMTLYLTDNLAQEELVRLSEEPDVVAVKYYPAGATTNSDSGVTSIEKVMPTLEVMAKRGIPLLIHGEVTDGEIDIFDREQRFIDMVLTPLRAQLPDLKIVLEHITTANAVAFVSEQSSNVAATITVHHLLYNRNHLLAGGIRPHFYCLPVLKRNSHQLALIEAATSGNPKFFLGTDSAPHPKGDKEAACGCAGIYTAPGALELYTEVFDQAKALDRLEGFASLYGPRFYGLPVNAEKISLVRDSWQMEESFQFGSNTVIPVRAGETLHWRLAV
ncbi:MAG: dihydroorotase [Gammaproteobacteria bacterium]|nr:dihydroorotase [Gammaproteobacteria bacterium]